jgi:hypothetical protein
MVEVNFMFAMMFEIWKCLCKEEVVDQRLERLKSFEELKKVVIEKKELSGSMKTKYLYPTYGRKGTTVVEIQ